MRGKGGWHLLPASSLSDLLEWLLPSILTPTRRPLHQPPAFTGPNGGTSSPSAPCRGPAAAHGVPQHPSQPPSPSLPAAPSAQSLQNPTFYFVQGPDSPPTVQVHFKSQPRKTFLLFSNS